MQKSMYDLMKLLSVDEVEDDLKSDDIDANLQE